MLYHNFVELIIAAADKCEATGAHVRVSFNPFINTPTVGFSINGSDGNVGWPINQDEFHAPTYVMKDACSFWNFPEGSHQIFGGGKWGYLLLHLINTEEGRTKLRRHTVTCRNCAILVAESVMRV